MHGVGDQRASEAMKCAVLFRRALGGQHAVFLLKGDAVRDREGKLALRPLARRSCPPAWRSLRPLALELVCVRYVTSSLFSLTRNTCYQTSQRVRRPAWPYVPRGRSLAPSASS